MKHRSAINAVCTIVFMLGVLVGTLMHGHILWHDILAAVVAGVLFGGMLFTQFRLVMRKVLKPFKKN